MFKKKELIPEETTKKTFEKKPVNINTGINKQKNKQNVNTILKGSKLSGDIVVSYDFELNGDVEGNIKAEENSNIAIKGACKGNIMTDQGNVNIEGELSDGDIISGGDVKITGKFNGGKIEAKGKIYVNGEFSGRMDGNEIEIGASSRGKGELFYKESISISKGAQIEVQVSQKGGAPKKAEMNPEDRKPEDVDVVLELPADGESEITIH
jgi:cytoskeletal protein CcmA (bactofilin family)